MNPHQRYLQWPNEVYSGQMESIWPIGESGRAPGQWVPVKCETKQKRNGTKRNRSKRNENKSKRNETDRNETKQIETKRNKTKRNKSKRNETNDMARHCGQKSALFVQRLYLSYT